MIDIYIKFNPKISPHSETFAAAELPTLNIFSYKMFWYDGSYNKNNQKFTFKRNIIFWLNSKINEAKLGLNATNKFKKLQLGIF